MYKVLKCTNQLYDALNQEKPKSIEVFEPHPDVIPKIRDKYRFTILITGNQYKTLMKFVKKTITPFKKNRSVIITIDPDISPKEFLK